MGLFKKNNNEEDLSVEEKDDLVIAESLDLFTDTAFDADKAIRDQNIPNEKTGKMNESWREKSVEEIEDKYQESQLRRFRWRN